MFALIHLVAEDPAPVPGAETAVFVLSAPVVSFLLNSLIPVITALVTKWTTSSSVKAILTIVLSVVTSALVTAVTVDGSAVISNQFVLTVIFGLFSAWGTYRNFWRPLKVSSSTPGPFSGPGASTDPNFTYDRRAA